LSLQTKRKREKKERKEKREEEKEGEDCCQYPMCHEKTQIPTVPGRGKLKSRIVCFGKFIFSLELNTART